MHPPAVLGCTRSQAVLENVLVVSHNARKQVKLTLATTLNHAAQKASFYLTAGHRLVAGGKVAKNGLLTVYAPLPPSSLPLDAVRYAAVVGGKTKAQPVKLSRRLIAQGVTVKGKMVTFSGQVVLPLSRPAHKVAIYYRESCSHSKLVANVAPNADGSFKATFKLPRGATSNYGVYRAQTQVVPNSHSTKLFMTYTLSDQA